MKKRLILVAGIGIGYVLGARAGRQKYDDLVGKANDVWQDPRVQEKVGAATDAVKDKAPEVAGQASAKAKDLSGKAADKARESGQSDIADKIDKAGDQAASAANNAGRQTADAAGRAKGQDAEKDDSKDGDIREGSGISSEGHTGATGSPTGTTS